jgi:ABC-type multidrug transport system fused ATPase/permease subunit
MKDMDINKQLNDISEIKNMMEKSSKFISLSGLSGVFAGIFALIGAGIIYFKYQSIYNSRFQSANYFQSIKDPAEFYKFTLITLIIILILALASGIFFTLRKAKKNKNLVWDKTSKRMLINLFIPLATGAFFAAILVYHNLFFLIAPATLIFYGLALINASKFTLHDVKYLGILEVILGLIASWLIGYGLIFWVIGFGILHIIYGITMYIKYDR